MADIFFPIADSAGSSDPQRAGVLPQRGIIVGGPAAVAQRRESMALLAVYLIGSAGAAAWTFTHGIGFAEIFVFFSTYCLFMFATGALLHRFIVHRAFKCGTKTRIFFYMLTQMVCQGSILKWTCNHRRHHQYPDKPGDPHSPYLDGLGNPIRGFASFKHAFNGWLFDEIVSDPKVFAPDLLADPAAMFFTRTRWFWYFVSMAVLPACLGLAVGGPDAAIGSILVGGPLRAYAVTLVTASLAYFCHGAGTARFAVDDHSTNVMFLDFLALGEGLHNNHHRFPRDAVFAKGSGEFDLDGKILLALARTGLIWELFDAHGRAGSPTHDAEAIRLTARGRA